MMPMHCGEVADMSTPHARLTHLEFSKPSVRFLLSYFSLVFVIGFILGIVLSCVKRMTTSTPRLQSLALLSEGRERQVFLTKRTDFGHLSIIG